MQPRINKFLLILLLFVFSNFSNAQSVCTNWQQVFFDDFEYNTQIPGLDPSKVYHTTPMNLSSYGLSANHTPGGSRGMYMNIQNGVSGLIYRRPFVGLCVGENYRYAFQGQEFDRETGLVNYTYRMHDPRLGRFFAVDPLADKYPHNSPYAFSENVVINAVELEGLERNYVFNSAYLSAKALTVIQTQSYSEVKQYLDNLVGTRFDSYENLKYAKEKLGKNFDDASGYASDGVTALSYGNRAVRGSYQSRNSTADYFYVRLVIDNGNGTWSTKNLKVTDYAGRINKIDRELASISKKIASNNAQIAQLEENNAIVAKADFAPSPGSFREVKGKASVDWEEMSYKGGQFLMMLKREAKINSLKENNLKLENQQKSLESKKQSFENKNSVEVID